jgi:hypothetical protein
VKNFINGRSLAVFVIGCASLIVLNSRLHHLDGYSGSVFATLLPILIIPFSGGLALLLETALQRRAK